MELRLKKIRLAIVGAGELGLQAMHYATLCNPQYGTYEVTGFIDDTKCCSDTVCTDCLSSEKLKISNCYMLKKNSMQCLLL